LARFGWVSRPAFLIIGAQKAGTVALYNYLSTHPSIIPAREKEISFFSKDLFYDRGEAWYHGHFPLCFRPGRALSFEATPVYLYYPWCAERILAYDAGIKLIVLLRDPVERAYSAWNMFRDMYHNDPEYLRRRVSSANDAVRRALNEMLSRDSFPGFHEAVLEEITQMPPVATSPEPSYVRRGLYTEQLRRYFKHFERDQVLVVDSRLLRDETQATLDGVVRFLGLPEHDWRQQDLLHLHVGRYERARMPDETRSLLREFYRPHNEELYDLLGCDFGWG
jgi:hypothetical protein